MSLYENHIFKKELPVIFHQDHIGGTGHKRCISNWHENIELRFLSGSMGCCHRRSVFKRKSSRKRELF